MEIGTQIKKYRQDLGLSQEALAEEVFVTRQTISNWENGKKYPDINSLVLLSNLFDISLDILVKGDLKTMEEQIKEEDIKKWNRGSLIFFVLLAATAVLAVPLFLYGHGIGVVLWILLVGVTVYDAVRIEKQKKIHNIQTYREIVAFTQGKRLDEIEKIRESAKRPYQTVLYAIVAGCCAAAVCLMMLLILD